MFPSLQERGGVGGGGKNLKSEAEQNAPKAAEKGEHRLQTAPPRPPLLLQFCRGVRGLCAVLKSCQRAAGLH